MEYTATDLRTKLRQHKRIMLYSNAITKILSSSTIKPMLKTFRTFSLAYEDTMIKITSSKFTLLVYVTRPAYIKQNTRIYQLTGNLLDGVNCDLPEEYKNGLPCDFQLRTVYNDLEILDIKMQYCNTKSTCFYLLPVVDDINTIISHLRDVYYEIKYTYSSR